MEKNQMWTKCKPKGWILTNYMWTDECISIHLTEKVDINTLALARQREAL